MKVRGRHVTSERDFEKYWSRNSRFPRSTSFKMCSIEVSSDDSKSCITWVMPVTAPEENDENVVSFVLARIDSWKFLIGVHTSQFFRRFVM